MTAEAVSARNNAVQSTVMEICTNPQLRKQYRQKPDEVLDQRLKDLATPADRAQAKAEIKQRINEIEEVFPGLTREEARRLLVGSLDLPRWSFTIFTILNICLFGVGIGLLVAAAVVGLVKGEEQITAMFGAGGLATILGVFIADPIKKIGNSAADQSQLRTVVFGFWVQLANWRTELLAPADQLDFNTIKDVNEEVQRAMQQAVRLLERYAEDHGKPAATQATQPANDEVDGRKKEPAIV
jgi:hypothetical protein